MSKLHMMCPVNGTGYGITSKNIAMSLKKSGVEISLFAIGRPSVETQEENDQISSALNKSLYYNPSDPILKIWHQHDLATRPGKGKYHAFPFFELDTFKEFEVHQMNQVDHLFTASNWGKNILEQNGVTVPITVAPLGVNLEVFKPASTIKFAKNSYVFLHIGKWEKRKSQDFLIKAFNNAFTNNDDVELWLVPDNPFLTEEETNTWVNLAAESPLVDKIRIINRLPTQYQLAEVIENCDCGIFPSRAEGWNNEIPEVMALDKPIIATNYSAHTEYCNNDNSLLIDVDQLEPAYDGKWFHGEGNWAKLDIKQLEQTVEYMRFVYNKEVKSNPAGLETAKKYTWDRTASIIRETIFN